MHSDLAAASESEAASDEAEASDGSFAGETDEEGVGGPDMLVEPPSAPVGGRVWDARDEAWSQQTRDLYDIAWENLNKPSWVVYPSHVKKVLVATVPLMQPGVVLSAQVEQFMRELVPETFVKCYDDHAVYRWQDNIQLDILEMGLELMELVTARLALVGGASAEADEADLVPLLSSLAPMFDADLPFHAKHRLSALPLRAAKVEVDTGFAVPQPEVDDAITENAAGQFESGKVQSHRWLTLIVNYFGTCGCLAALVQLLERPDRASLRTLEACLKPLAKVAPLLEPRYRESCVQGVNNVLTYAMEMLEQPDLLAKARDKNLATLSSLMRHAQTLLSAIMPPARAARTVIVVQRGLVLAMLTASTFSQQLAGVREINAMLDAASPPPRPVVGPMLSDAHAFSQEAADAGVEENAKSAVQWLEAENVLSRTLRSHLHLKQYVEQVERIMRFLLRRGCLRDEHLDIVWSITEKQDTFEETKANMFALLAALAVDFSPSQLDSLFARFEHGRDRSAADTVKILGLITALARGDASGVLAKRLTDLLWTQLLAPEAPPEALVTLVDVVNNYAASAPDCRSTIISRCLDNVASGVSVLPSVQLLRHLLVTQPMGDGYTTDGPTLQSLVERQREEVAQLNQARGVVGLLLGELEQYMATARAAVAAGATAPPGDGRASHSDCLTERLSFLSGLLLAGGIELGIPEVDRLWACMMTGAAQPSDADVLANWLKQIPAAAMHGQPMLSLDAARHVLSTLGSVPPARLTPALWACMPVFVVMVGISAGHLRIPVPTFGDVLPPFNPSSSSKAASMGIPLLLTLEFEGLSRVWDAALEAPSPVCDLAIQWLAWLYPQLSGATPAETLSLRQTLVGQAEAFLNAAHAKLVATPAGAAAAAAKRVDNVLRLLDIILAQIDAPHHAARHAARLAPPVHGATYSGRTVTIEYQWTIKAQHYRHYLHAPGNQYGAALRPVIAAGVGVPVDRVRILWAGRELSGPDCAQTPCSKIENAVINVMILPMAPAAAVQPVAGGVDSDPDTPSMETEAAPVSVLQPPLGAMQDNMLSARQLLAAMPGLYDTLYSLADAGHAGLCTHATAILNALPTRAETRAHLESLLPAGISGPDLAAAAADSRLQLSSALRAPPAARAYTLQILEGLMIPVNGFVSDAAATAALSAFRALGGPELILSALSPSSLPENIGAVPLRSLFLSGLNLLRLVAVDPDAGSFTRDLADVDSAADRFAADMVDVLFWLLPRTAMGRLGSSGDAPGTTDAGGDADMAFDDAATNLYSLVNGDSQALDPNDAFLTSMGLTLLTHALGQRSGGVMRLLSRPDAANVLSDLLLRCPSPALREAAAIMCVDLVSRENVLPPSPSHPAPSTGVAAMSGSGGSGAATAAGAAPLAATGGEDAANAAAVAATRRAMLGMLLAMRAHAEESPTTCRSYFELVSSLLSGSAASGQDGAVLDELLADEVRWLTTAEPCTDPADCRLEGHLSLVLALVRGLRRRNVVTPAGRSLLTLLLRKFLFPELEFLERQEDEADLDDDAVLLTAVASTPRTRSQAFLLVIALATHDASALREVLETLRKLHFEAGPGTLVADFTPSGHWERMQQYTSRRANSFVGLGNGGATCYMNSVFQQLFMQPNIRRNVLSAVDATDAAPADSVLCQLQATFGALHASRLDHHRPESFWQAFKDYDGQPVNVREHQDALEFLTRLQEQVDAAVKPPAAPGAPPPAPGTPPGPTPPLEQVLGGMLVNQIVCRTCPAHRSEKDESFTSLPVDIRNKSGLLESLSSFVQGELLEGDNQWVCEACGRKVDAVKRQTVKSLPQMLCIQLKRFEYDYETMQRLKVKDRFEFPTELDMRPFTREGMDEAAASPADAVPTGTPDDKYAYTLMGVVVHSGSAFAGHYYSYIRERVVAPDGTVSAGSWHVFDDKRVEPYDAANLERDTFGGKFSSEGWDHVRKINTQIEYDRPNSAYMLFYERLGTRDEALRADLAGDVAMDGPAATAQLAVRLPPSVAAEVRAANAQCVYESHMLSRDYFAFVRGLVDANVEYSRKRRREAPASMLADLSAATPSADVLCCELATNFLIFVYSRSAHMLREDSVTWLASLTNLLESSRGACCWFLHWLTDPARKNTLRMMLCRAAGEDVRELWGKLCFSAIRSAALHHPDVSRYETLAELSEEDFEASEVQVEDLPSLVHALILQVIEYLEPVQSTRTRTAKEPHLEAVLTMLYDYAKLGPVQRTHVVLCEGHHALGDFAVQRLSPYSPPRLDNTGSVGSAVHITLAFLLRGVGGAAYPNKASAPPNPFALPSGTGTCPALTDHVIEWSKIYRDKYIPLMVEAAMQNDDVISLACYLAWGSSAESRLLIDSILDELHQTRHDDHDIMGLFRLIQLALSLNDNFKQNRLNLFLHGENPTHRAGGVVQNDAPLPGFIDLLVGQTTNPYKRMFLLRWLVVMHDVEEAPNFMQPLPEVFAPSLLRAANMANDELERIRQSNAFAVDTYGPSIARARAIAAAAPAAY